MGFGVLWKIIVTHHSPPLHQEMQLEIVLCKEKGIYSFLRRNAQPSSLGPKSSEMDRKTVETCSLVRRVHIFGKTCQKMERRTSDCYVQQKVQKPASVMVWGCISDSGMGDQHICEGTIDAMAYVGILERHMLQSRRRLFPGTPCLFQQDNARPHSAQVKTVCLRRHRVRVLDWPACLG